MAGYSVVAACIQLYGVGTGFEGRKRVPHLSDDGTNHQNMPIPLRTPDFQNLAPRAPSVQAGGGTPSLALEGPLHLVHLILVHAGSSGRTHKHVEWCDHSPVGVAVTVARECVRLRHGDPRARSTLSDLVSGKGQQRGARPQGEVNRNGVKCVGGGVRRWRAPALPSSMGSFDKVLLYQSFCAFSLSAPLFRQARFRLLPEAVLWIIA